MGRPVPVITQAWLDSWEYGNRTTALLAFKIHLGDRLLN
jgi:hypothetical protein